MVWVWVARLVCLVGALLSNGLVTWWVAWVGLSFVCCVNSVVAVYYTFAYSLLMMMLALVWVAYDF